MTKKNSPWKDLLSIVYIALALLAIIGDGNMRIIVLTVLVVLFISMKIYELQRDKKINKEK